MGRQDYETETLIPTRGGFFDVAHSLRAEGFDASEDGTGRRTPLVTAFYPTNRQPEFGNYEDISPAIKIGSSGSSGNPPAIAFSAKDHGADAGEIAPTLRSMGHDGSHANGGGQVAVAFQTNTNGDDGMEVDGISVTLKSERMPAVAFSIMPMNSGKDYKARETDVAQPIMAVDYTNLSLSDEVVGTLEAAQSKGNRGHGVLAHAFKASHFTRGKDGAPSDVVPPLKAQSGETGKGDAAPLVAFSITEERIYGSAPETYAVALLRRVRGEIGAEAFSQWGLGILASLQPSQILRPKVHGQELRQATFSRSWVVCCTLGSPFPRAEGAMRSLREACGEGCPSQGWQPLEQCADELGTYLSGLSQPGPQAERFMHDLLAADEGAGLLRQALSAIQETRRSADGEGQPVRSGMQVRRLTATECEFLQGFPRGYTLIPWRGGMSPDGNRYKALGNSMAVPVMRWIGQRIAMVEGIK